MAKRNRSKAKQRRKRHLKKRINTTTKALSPVTKVKAAPSNVLYLGKYSDENTEYQQALDAIYEGKVKPIEAYLNPNATLIHYCSGCRKRFYGRPQWLLGVYPHVCFGNHAYSSQSSSKAKKETITDWDTFHQMIWDDLNYQEIASKMGVNPALIKDYFQREGLM